MWDIIVSIFTYIYECLISWKLWSFIFIFATIDIIRTYLKNKTVFEDYRTTAQCEYDEEKIIGHLNYIIVEALNQYNILNITPKNIYYIDSKLEQAIIEHLVSTVPERISPTLMAQLKLIYNSNYISTFLGQHIYMIVLNYVLDFNTPAPQIQSITKSF